MRKVTFRRVDFNPVDPYPSYSMELTVTSADDMPKAIFVKQRFGDDSTTDAFAAIASVAQLEDLPETAPEETTSYFRADSVRITALNQETLDFIYSEILSEIQLLVANLDALENEAGPERIVEVTGDSVSVL